MLTTVFLRHLYYVIISQILKIVIFWRISLVYLAGWQGKQVNRSSSCQPRQLGPLLTPKEPVWGDPRTKTLKNWKIRFLVKKDKRWIFSPKKEYVYIKSKWSQLARNAIKRKKNPPKYYKLHILPNSVKSKCFVRGAGKIPRALYPPEGRGIGGGPGGGTPLGVGAPLGGTGGDRQGARFFFWAFLRPLGGPTR